MNRLRGQPQPWSPVALVGFALRPRTLRIGLGLRRDPGGAATSRIKPLLAALSLVIIAGRLAAAPPAVDFNRDVRPLLSDHCYACHGPDDGKRKAGLRLDQRASALGELKSGNRAVVPGQPGQSTLVRRLASSDPDEVMPPPGHNKPLTREQVATLTRWVAEGAEWKDHWSFIAPKRPKPPAVRHASWPSNDLDRFILARLEASGLTVSAEAERPVLLRRVTLDLTGLPPSPEDVDAFLADRSPRAYERVVDRLLASPHFGERMAVNWLDLARYADTAGYHFDGIRFMWLWRDWVINAFNQNKPFDVFTVEQLAGDLLPQPTRDQRLATGFVRNNMTNDEGGADPDEYLNKYVADRVNTLGSVWLGMTVGCAECHDHKFDPLRTSEFYQLYAFFHNVPEKGLDRIRTDNPPPRLPFPSPSQAERLVEAEFRLRDAEKTLQDRVNELGETQEKWERETLASPPAAPAEESLEVRLAFDGDLAVDRRENSPKAFSRVEPPNLSNNPSPRDSGERVPEGRERGSENEVRGEGSAATAQSATPARLVPEAQPEFSEGRLGKALKLDGKSHVDSGPLVAFGRTNSFSYTAWIRIQSSGAVLSCMDKGPGYHGFDLFVSDGRIEVHLVDRYPDDALKVKTREKFEGTGWRHVTVTYNGSGKAGGVRVYVDGRGRELETEKDQLKGDFAGTEPVRIGSRNGDGFFQGLVDDVRFYGRTLGDEDARLLAFQGMMTILKKSRGQRSEEERADLQRFYKEGYAVDFLRSERALVLARQEKERLVEAIPTAMVMEEMEPARETFRLVRGDFRVKGERVFPATPAFLPQISKMRALDTGGRLRFEADTARAAAPLNRLDLAAWLVSPAHPLTARVTVNRYWAMFFGAGLVKTVNDFGAQGEWPSHPELLDWLACRFRDGDPKAYPPVAPWDVKALVRLIVTSRTYRQSSAIAPGRLERDPYNRLLGRSPRLALDAEFVRDHALAASGLLNPQIGGPSVKPYQPPGLWDGTDSKFVQDHGQELYRRGLYVYWRRSAHYPAFATFDAPNREVCTFLRQRTQTPLQSLVLMNDPAFVECARGLAERVTREEPASLQKRLVRAFRLTLGRPPGRDEIATLQRTYDQQLTNFRADAKSAEALLAVGESKSEAGADIVPLAAMTAVANVLLNLNETITR